MALNKLTKWIGTQAMTAFFDQLNDNVDATNAAIDLAEQNAANYNAPQAAPYESGDNRWRDIYGVGFYYAGTSNVGYPSTTGILIHFRISSATTVTWQMFIGNGGQIWTRRVTAAANFSDSTWVQV